MGSPLALAAAATLAAFHAAVAFAPLLAALRAWLRPARAVELAARR